MHPHDTDDADDTFDRNRHLISDEDLTRLALATEAAELTLRGPVDPLAAEVDHLRAGCEAYAAWCPLPEGWTAERTMTGHSYHRGALQVVARLTPQATPGRHLLRLSVDRPGGAALADLLAAVEAFVPAGCVVRVGALLALEVLCAGALWWVLRGAW